MAKAFSGKKPQHFGNTIRVFLNYLGRHKFMLGLVGVLTLSAHSPTCWVPT